MQMILRTLTLTPILILVLFATPALGQPGPATLIAPSADVVGSTIAFTWQSSATATWYHFWLGRADTALVMEQWHTAEHAGCASGGTCTITLTPPITAGAFIWHIRTWAASGYGPWSTAHMFTMRDVAQAWSGKLPSSRRFTLVLENQGVLDNETGLVWQRSPSPALMRRSATLEFCFFRNDGGRRAWRTPSLSELMSLIDPARSAPALPEGHPFIIQQYVQFWSATQAIDVAARFHGADFVFGGLNTAEDSPTVTMRTWCVRGGTPTQ
jgi:hypothetical protein